jgi:hypothetical protein
VLWPSFVFLGSPIDTCLCAYYKFHYAYLNYQHFSTVYFHFLAYLTIDMGASLPMEVGEIDAQEQYHRYL